MLHVTCHELCIPPLHDYIASSCTYLHRIIMPIDSTNEEQPLIEEPEDQVPEEQHEENPEAAPDSIPKAPSDPSEEGR